MALKLAEMLLRLACKPPPPALGLRPKRVQIHQGLERDDFGSIVIASEAKQSRAACDTREAVLDCFVAIAPRNDGGSGEST
jgi:hypothetical protein